MKQEGRTEQELAESYCFLFPDKSKVSLSAASYTHTHNDDLELLRFVLFTRFFLHVFLHA